jgi:ADP-ribose pyrophosphatase YjhB (NUDIX family)
LDAIGGHIESGESAEAAIRRGLAEEIRVIADSCL